MSSTKSTKRALLSSVIAMFICVAMLIGTTFAWFTDSASTAVNKIQAGTLKVQLLDASTLQSILNQPLTWKTEDNRDQSEILWEPGCTYELQPVVVKNAGSLSLKYKVVITGINGDAKLNEVINWTINGADIGTEYHLVAGQVSEPITVSGHMKEDAGNEYKGLSIDSIAITVYAVQDTVESDSNGNTYDQNADGTPQFDTWLDNVSATESVTGGSDTVIKDRVIDPTITAVIPADSTVADTLTLIKTKTDTPSNISVVTGTVALSADIRLVDQNGNKVSASGGKFFTLSMQLDANLNVIDFYHNGTALTLAESAEAVGSTNDSYYYDSSTGLLTFTTDDFSTFTVMASKSAFNGGTGTSSAPYLIATADQALKMKNSKGYFKLAKDIVVSNEIYLSGKTYTLDLNGHSIRLEYGEGIKPNNGSALYIAGKNGNLTINDSSEAQTGAVYGSDKNYSGKVTSAVRAGNYGKLTINGGHFYGMSEGTSCIFVCTSRASGAAAKVTINGGVFETASPSGGTYFVLNHEDRATAGCKITVNGGKFKNYNPGVTQVDPANAYTGKIVLGTGCTTASETVGDDIWYTVSK